MRQGGHGMEAVELHRNRTLTGPGRRLAHDRQGRPRAQRHTLTTAGRTQAQIAGEVES
jgi:hypothetical protein